MGRAVAAPLPLLALATASAAMIAGGCIGVIETEPGSRETMPEPEHRPDDPMPPTRGGSDPMGGGGQPPGSTPLGAKPMTFTSAASRLTAREYRNTIADVFGTHVMVPALEDDPAVAGFRAVGATKVSTSASGVEQYEAAARAVAAQVVTDGPKRAQLVACGGTAGPDDDCLKTTLVRLGRLLFRRPLTTQELDRYRGLARDTATLLADRWAGLEHAVAALLQSPKFLYRIELGHRPTPGAAPTRYTGYELASRLSFFLWGTSPDATLLDAAEKGELATAAALQAHARRMAASPRARLALREFFTEALALGELDERKDDVEPSLLAAMAEETLRLAEHLAYGERDFREILTSRQTYVNAALAKHYGLPPPTGSEFALVTLPTESERIGFLGHASFLVQTAAVDHTSPTARGKFVRERLLCQMVPAPPPGIDATLPPEDALRPRTMRERLAAHRADPVCRNCHGLIDPIGLAFETFDGRGLHRSEENGARIDPSGELDGAAFTDAQSLAALLASRPEVGPCLVRKLFRHATGREEAHSDQAALDALAAHFAGKGHKLDLLVTDLATSELFVAPPMEVEP